MRSSSDAVPRAVPDSRRSGRPYRSLRGRSDFREIYRKGSRRRVHGVVAIRLPGRAGPPRVGIVAAKGVGNAVKRNRAKRRLREAVARVRLDDGVSYVVIASPEVLAAPFDRLVASVQAATAAKEDDGD